MPRNSPRFRVRIILTPRNELLLTPLAYVMLLTVAATIVLRVTNP